MKQLFLFLLLAHGCLLDGYFTVIPDFNSDSLLPAFSAVYDNYANNYYTNNSVATDRAQNSVDHIRQYRRQQYYDYYDHYDDHTLYVPADLVD